MKVSMSESLAARAGGGGDSFGRNTAVLFAAVAGYMFAGATWWVGVLLILSAVLMWRGGEEGTGITAIPA